MTVVLHGPVASGEAGPVPCASSELDTLLRDHRSRLAEELPEGFRAEIIEGAIEVAPTGSKRHAIIANRMRRALDAFLADGALAAFQDGNVIHAGSVFIPDVFVAAEDDDDPDGTGPGFDARAVHAVVEVVSPDSAARERDRSRKYRAYARAGIPVYVIVDDFDKEGDAPGVVTLYTDPKPSAALYRTQTRVPYGTAVVVPPGPLAGFVVDEAVTGRLGPTRGRC